MEVISPNTESTDRREKLISYRKIPSLMAYLIVEQDEMKVERHFRVEQDRWRQAELVGEGTLSVPCPPGAEPKLVEIYRGL